jgi:hypothetical protein
MLTRITAGLAVAAAFAFTVAKEGNQGLSIGDKAPMTTAAMHGTDGNMYTLEKAKKKNGLIVVFSCNTCPFVVGSDAFKGWEGQYNDINRLAAGHDIGMILVNSNEAKRKDDDSMDAMIEHGKKLGYDMPYVADENSSLANAFGAKTTPHVYFFNSNMELIYTGAIDNTVEGKRSKDENYLKDAINAHAKSEKIAVTSTPPRGCSIKRAAK